MAINYEVEKMNENIDNQSQIEKKMKNYIKLNIYGLRQEVQEQCDETETYLCTQEKKNNGNEGEKPLNTEADNSQTIISENKNVFFFSENPNKNEKIKTDNNSIGKKQYKFLINIFAIYSLNIKIEIQNYYLIEEEKKDIKDNYKIHIYDAYYKNIENEKTRDKIDNINEEKINEKNKIVNQPIFKIPIEELQKAKNKKISDLKNIENLKRNLNSKINSDLLPNRSNFINAPPTNSNNSGLNNNNIFNTNNVYNQKLALHNEQKIKFQQLKDLGITAIKNPQNINHYLFNSYVNNVYFNNINQCLPFNNNMNINLNTNYNYNNMGYIGSPLFRNFGNYLPNQSYMNNGMNSIYNMNNNLKGLDILNNLNNLNNQNYIITLKSKTNDPTIEKVSKIQVTTYCVKDNSKKVENNDVIKKEKIIKNIINLDSILSGKETRTVVRLNPIPPNYSSFDVCKLLDKYLQIESGKNQRIYKALYTPLCKVIGKNLGYCFVMMVKPKYVVDFYNTFYGKSFGKKKCKKPCNVIWADMQGEDFLKASEDDPIRKPIIFKDIKTD